MKMDYWTAKRIFRKKRRKFKYLPESDRKLIAGIINKEAVARRKYWVMPGFYLCDDDGRPI